MATSVASIADVAVRVKPPKVILSPDANGLKVTVEAVEVAAIPAVITTVGTIFVAPSLFKTSG